MTEITERARVAGLLFYAAVILLGYLVFRVFQPFLVPLAWACVLVVVFYPWHARLEQRWGATRAAAFSTIAVTLILILPGLFLLTAFIREAVEAGGALRDEQSTLVAYLQRAWEWLQLRIPGLAEINLTQTARELAEGIAGIAAASAGTLLRNAALFLLNLAVMLFALFYLFRDAGAMVDGVRRLLPFEPAQRDRMMAQAHDLIFASVTSSLIVAAVQGLLGGITFALLGLGGAVFWGGMMAFCSFLPIVGAWLIWLPAAGWLFLSGENARAIILVVVGVGIIGTSDNVLRPMLISGRARLSGLVVFISVLGGISVFGMLGVILGPIVVATAAGLFEAYTKVETPAAVVANPTGSKTGAVLE